MSVLYLIGSLRNPRVPELASRLRSSVPEVEVFDDWFAAGFEADDYWKEYEKARGRSYKEALEGYAANHVFDFDKYHLNRSTHVLLVLPAGKSGHMELMYGKYGLNKHTAILLDPEDVRWDVMYKFIPDIFSSDEEVINWLEKTNEQAPGSKNGYVDVGKAVAPRRLVSKIEVPARFGLSGLLPECVGGSRSPLIRSNQSTSSRRTDALGSRQVNRTSR